MTLVRDRHHKSNLYTTINKTVMSDRTLSWTAKGIYGHLCSTLDDEDFCVEKFIQNSGDEAPAVRSALKELESAGYIKTTTGEA